jgi:taurine dioxygenase
MRSSGAGAGAPATASPGGSDPSRGDGGTCATLSAHRLMRREAIVRDVDPSGRMLGAEVRGIDLSQPLSADDKAFVEAAWTEHLVLLFREQRIGDEHLLALAEALGGAQAAGSRDFFVQAGYTESSGRISALPGISLISNLDENGRPVPHFAAEGELELQWHTDNSYVENPP